jgi:hypothetical protein
MTAPDFHEPQEERLVSLPAIARLADGNAVVWRIRSAERSCLHMIDVRVGRGQYPRTVRTEDPGSLDNTERNKIQHRLTDNRLAPAGSFCKVAQGQAVWVLPHGQHVESHVLRLVIEPTGSNDLACLIGFCGR